MIATLVFPARRASALVIPLGRALRRDCTPRADRMGETSRNIEGVVLSPRDRKILVSQNTDHSSVPVVEACRRHRKRYSEREGAGGGAESWPRIVSRASRRLVASARAAAGKEQVSFVKGAPWLSVGERAEEREGGGVSTADNPSGVFLFRSPTTTHLSRHRRRPPTLSTARFIGCRRGLSSWLLPRRVKKGLSCRTEAAALVVWGCYHLLAGQRLSPYPRCQLSSSFFFFFTFSSSFPNTLVSFFFIPFFSLSFSLFLHVSYASFFWLLPVILFLVLPLASSLSHSRANANHGSRNHALMYVYMYVSIT